MSLAKYSFYPWLRRGLSTKIIGIDNLGATPSIASSSGAEKKSRAEINIGVQLYKDSFEETISRNIELFGPGDVIGINSNAIIKMEPKNWVTNFEPNYLPYIDFYDEDFPWRFSPAKSNDKKLRPWLFLIVLKEDEFTRVNTAGNILPVINIIDKTDLPLKDEIWAWAHVHLNDSKKNKADLEILLKENPDLGCSRILCPRKLEAKQSYHAFLIPTFETGRLAGLGRFDEIKDTDAQLSSWDPSVPDSNFPVYYESYFSTGLTGDFESLARQLKPKDVDPSAGKRKIYLNEDSYPNALPNDSNANSTEVFWLEGALKTTTFSRMDFLALQLEDFRIKVSAFINSNSDLKNDIPIITPPIFGKWHILNTSLQPSANSWINELNLDPRNRTVAGFGCDVIRKRQDYYMKLAWEQLEKVNQANKLLMATVFASKVSNNIFSKHIEKQDEENFFSVTSPIHSQVKIDNQSLLNTASKSSNAGVLSNSSFRKVSNSAGTILRRLDKAVDGAVKMKSFKVSRMVTVSNAPVPEHSKNEVIQKLKSVNPNTEIIRTLTPAGFIDSSPPTINATMQTNLSSAFNKLINDLTGFIGNLQIEPQRPELNLSAVKTEVVSEYKKFYMDNGFAKMKILLNGSESLINYNVPVMAYPVLDIPMYTELRDLSLEYFFPNINLIPNNSVTLFETNNRFIESFMAGLNYEMARELLWREYPTDQRGSYFRLFWNKNDNLTSTGDKYDIKELNKWINRLGNNAPSAGTNKLVLSIRGDLLKKYPNTVIYLAQKSDNLFNNQRYPVFSAKVEPDIYFLGFDLAIETVKNESKPAEKWYFILQERPGEARFGLDVGNNIKNINVNLPSDNLSWDNVSTGTGDYIEIVESKGNSNPSNGWGVNSAFMASIFYQKPVLIAIPAKELLTA